MSSVGESVDLSVPVEVRVMGPSPVASGTVEALRCALDVVGVRGPYANRSEFGVRFYVTVRLPGEVGDSAVMSSEAFVAHMDSLGSAGTDEAPVGGRRG